MELKLIPFERREKILKLLKKEKICKISELSKYLDTSNMTVHRILNELEREGLVKKIHGGVRINESTSAKLIFELRMNLNYSQKKEIAKKALNFIEEDDIIFLDSSTTCFVLAKELAIQNINNVTLITNSPFIIYELSDCANLDIISTGGQLDIRTKGFVGPLAINSLEQIHIDKAFISSGGICLDKGIKSSFPFIIEIRKKVIEKADKVIFIGDSSKFKNNSLLTVASLDVIDFIITDSQLDKDIFDNFQKKGIKIVI